MGIFLICFPLFICLFLGSPVQPRAAKNRPIQPERTAVKMAATVFVRLRNHLDFLKLYVLRGVTSLRFLAGGVLEVFVDTLDVVQADISGFKLVKN